MCSSLNIALDSITESAAAKLVTFYVFKLGALVPPTQSSGIFTLNVKYNLLALQKYS